MRKLRSIIKSFGLLVALGVLASCSTTKQAVKLASYESLIPVTEQSIIISTNIAQVKSKISSDTQSTLNTFLNLALGADENLRWVSMLTNNPESTGLNTAKNVYYIAYPISVEKISHAIYLPLNDIAKFEKFLFSEIQLDQSKISEVAGLKYYPIDTELHLFYNNAIVSFVSSKEFFEIMAGSSKSLAASSLTTVKGANDLAISYTYDGMVALIKKLGKPSLNSLFAGNPLATSSSSALNFELGEIVFEQENYDATGKSDGTFNKALSLLKPVSGRFSKKIAKDPYFYGLMGMKGDGFMDLVESVLKAQGVNLERESKKEMLNVCKSFLNNVDGDVLFAVSDFSVGFSGVSIDGSLFIEGDAAKMFDVVLENMPKNLITTLEKNKMDIVVDKVKMTIGTHDGFFYATTNDDIARNPGAVKSVNLTDSRYYKKGKSVAHGSFDVKAILNNPLVKLALAQQKSSKDATTKELLEFLNGMDYMCSESTIADDVINTKSKIVIDQKSPNTLTVLIDMIVRIVLASK